MSRHNLKFASIVYFLYFHSEIRDFLTGFRKRKQERRQKAKDELEKQVKEERKRIKQEVANKSFMHTEICA